MIYQLRIELSHKEPLIWRRVLVAPDISLAKLHLVIQIVMGWQNCHLYQFAVQSRVGLRPSYYGNPDDHQSDDILNGKKIKLCHVLKEEGLELLYEYDMGDFWVHRVVLEKKESENLGGTAICLEGHGCCPPEDIGGISGFEDFLEAIRDVKHEDHKRMIRWGGRKFDPEKFSKNSVNALLLAKFESGIAC